MWDEVRAPPGAQYSVSIKTITARQLQALVRQLLSDAHSADDPGKSDRTERRRDEAKGPESKSAEPPAADIVVGVRAEAAIAVCGMGHDVPRHQDAEVHTVAPVRCEKAEPDDSLANHTVVAA